MKAILLSTICFVGIILSTGCATAPERPEAREVLSAQVKEAIAVFKEKDPGIQQYFDTSYGYVVLPKILKGAFWFGGAYGKGGVFEKSELAGYCDMKQATWGFSFGGEYFREIIFFKTKADLDKFKTGKFTFAAQATGVAASVGTTSKVDFKAGTAVFVTTDVGLMIDVSLGGQEFNYVSKESIED